MKKISFIFIIMLCFIFQSCELTVEDSLKIMELIGLEHIENLGNEEFVFDNCTQVGYSILYNGEFFTWRNEVQHYIYPRLFKTKKEAIRDANLYHRHMVENADVLLGPWVGVRTCKIAGYSNINN